MQMVFHMGVHSTDGDRMLKTLLNNRSALQKVGTEIVTPNSHRGMFDEALKSLNGGTATPEMEQIMLDAMLASDHTSRVVMSTPTFMGAPGRAVGRDGLYPQMGPRAAALARLFPSSQAEFFVALRNPATLLTDVLPQIAGSDYSQMMHGHHPTSLRWRDAIQNLARVAQGRRMVIWCHEDVPLIWPEIVRLAGGLPLDVPLSDGLLYMHEILGDEGIAQLRDAMGDRDQVSVSQRRAIYAGVLEKHARPGTLDQDITLPGWTQEIVDQVTENYRADIGEIAVLPGVEFVLP